MLFLRTFGGLSLENGGRPVVGAAGQRRRLAILAALAVAGDRGVSRDSLYALFWPDSDIERARGALKQALYALRRDTDESTLTLGTADLVLNPEVIRSDVTQFEQLIRTGDLGAAVSLYTGPFLQGIHLRNQEEFERWSDRQRERLAAAHIAALEKLSADAMAAADFRNGLEWHRRLTEAQPLSERFAVRFMEAMIAAGDRDGARRHGLRYASLLQSELGVEPDAPVKRILDELVRDPTPVLQRAKSATVSSLRPGQTPANLSRTEFVRADVSLTEIADSKHASSRDTGNRWKKPVAFAALSAAIITVGAGVSLGGVFSDRSSRQSGDRAAGESTIMIADFANVTGDPSMEPLGQMASDWVIQGLSNTQLIRVIDAGTAAVALRNLRKQGIDPYSAARDIARTTGATNVVTGSIYRSGDSIQIHARLTDASGQVRAVIEPVRVAKTEALKGIEVLRQRMLGVLAREFDPRVAELVDSASPPPTFAAYVEYVKGVRLVTEGDNKGALPHLRKAYSLDTSFVTSLVWSVHALQNDYQYPQASALIDSLMPRRHRLAPLDRYAIQAMYADLKNNEYDKIAFGKAAADIAPSSQWPWVTAVWLMTANRPKEALRYLGKVDPSRWLMDSPHLQLNYWLVVSTVKHMIEDYSGALEATLRARSVDADAVKIEGILARDLVLVGRETEIWTPIARIVSSRKPYTLEALRRLTLDLTRHSRHDIARAVADTTFALYRAFATKPTEDEDRPIAQIHYYLEHLDDAEREFAGLVRKYPKSEFLCEYRGMLAVLAAQKGDTARATNLAERIPPTCLFPGETEYWHARVQAQLGQRSKAVQLLKSALAKGAGNMWIWHSRRPDFPTLYGYRPFEELVTPEP